MQTAIIYSAMGCTDLSLPVNSWSQRLVYSPDIASASSEYTSVPLDIITLTTTGTRIQGQEDAALSGAALPEGREDSLVIRCNESLETWYLTCQHNRWHGDLGNCSTAHGASMTRGCVAYENRTCMHVGAVPICHA